MSQRIRAAPTLRDRSSLLGVTPPASGRSSPLSNPQNVIPGGQRYADDLEGQNDEALAGLSAKVRQLRDIGVEIGNITRDSVTDLSEMNDVFGETSGILAGTFRRMNAMSKRQGCQWLWWIMFLVIVLWFFLFVWWWRR